VDVLFKTPWGLQPPGSPPRKGSGGNAFLQNYEGAWQELFPNTFTPCRYQGKEVPLHGEVATLPWDFMVECDDAEEARIRLDVVCRQMPLALTRCMSLSRSSRTLILDEIVRNVSDKTTLFVWGHHPVLGPPFLEAGCRIETERCSVFTASEPAEATHLLAPGQHSYWPYARRRDGGEVDLRTVSGPEAGTHDHAYLTDFERGWVMVENPRLGLAFELEWNPAVFGWLINWRPFGGSHLPPLEGIYGMGIELWATRANLTSAIADGDALSIGAGAVMQTSLRATLRRTVAPCSI
jgi:Domain of unknown function (DUF4432)